MTRIAKAAIKGGGRRKRRASTGEGREREKELLAKPTPLSWPIDARFLYQAKSLLHGSPPPPSRSIPLYPSCKHSSAKPFHWRSDRWLVCSLWIILRRFPPRLTHINTPLSFFLYSSDPLRVKGRGRKRAPSRINGGTRLPLPRLLDPDSTFPLVHPYSHSSINSFPPLLMDVSFGLSLKRDSNAPPNRLRNSRMEFGDGSEELVIPFVNRSYNKMEN